MDPHLVFDGRKYKRRRERLGLRQKQVGDRIQTMLPPEMRDDLGEKDVDISQRTVSRIETGRPGVTLPFYEFYASALGKRLDFFRFDPEYNHDDARALGVTVRAMVNAAYHKGLDYIRHPYPVRLRPTSKRKITDRPITEDPTLVIDQVMSDAMREVVRRLSMEVWHPFNKEIYIQCDEEVGARKVPDDASGRPKFVLSTDGCDHTDAVVSGTGGAAYAQVYQFGVGMMAASGLDITRGVLLSRVRGGNTEAIQLCHNDGDGASVDMTPRGSVIALLPSRATGLSNASICIYMGKAYRIPLTASLGSRLLDGQKDIKIESHGGSRGSMLCAEGRLAAATEFVKGFKHLDGLPGCWLAQGAGATVLSLNNGDADRLGEEEMDFGSDPEFEDIFGQEEEEWSDALEKLRYKFIVAGTPELATKIHEKLCPRVET